MLNTIIDTVVTYFMFPIHVWGMWLAAATSLLAGYIFGYDIGYFKGFTDVAKLMKEENDK